MLNKNDILDAIVRDLEITRHLATKVTPENSEFRHTPGQRTILEVLRYLSFCGMGGAASMVDGNWDRYKEWSGKTENLSIGEISGAIDTQIRGLNELFASISDDDFATKEAVTPIGEKMPLCKALLEIPVKWVGAYKMQLFLTLKSAGLEELSTYNCWGGMDRPVEA